MIEFYLCTSYPTVLKGPPDLRWGNLKVVPSGGFEYS